jgi:hypothetical protein
LDIKSIVAHQLKYPYEQQPLRNGEFDWLPILPVQLRSGSNLTALLEVIIDSGAFDCLFHRRYGHEIRLHVGADSFKIEAFFSDQLPVAGLLGRNGFFDKYVVSFDPSGKIPGVELTRVRKKS